MTKFSRAKFILRTDSGAGILAGIGILLLPIPFETWSLVCAGIILINWNSISILGIIHLGFEGIFVLTLAVLEYKFVRPVNG